MSMHATERVCNERTMLRPSQLHVMSALGASRKHIHSLYGDLLRGNSWARLSQRVAGRHDARITHVYSRTVPMYYGGDRVEEFFIRLDVRPRPRPHFHVLQVPIVAWFWAGIFGEVSNAPYGQQYNDDNGNAGYTADIANVVDRCTVPRGVSWIVFYFGKCKGEYDKGYEHNYDETQQEGRWKINS